MAVSDLNHSPNPEQESPRSTPQPPTHPSIKWMETFLSQPRLILNLLMLLIFSGTWIRDCIYWFPKDAFGTSLNYWAFTDWLIDYSHGFIRRGLSGEMWRLVPSSVPPLEFVAVFSWVLILIVAFSYVRLLARSWKTLHPLTLFGLLFLPSLLMFYLHDHNGIARKEILGYITLLLHLLIIEKAFPFAKDSAHLVGSLKRYVMWLIPVTVILLPATILVHEGNFLMFVPLHVIITLSVFRIKTSRTFLRSAVWTALLFVPAGLAFLAVYLSGTPSYPQLLGLCQKWAAVGAIREGSCVLPPEKLSGSTLPGSFIPMQWPVAEAAYITQRIVFSNWISWVLILPVLGGAVWYLIRQAVYSILRVRSMKAFSAKSARKYSGLFYVKYFVLPMLCSLPVYFTAYDYGRWFTVTCINFALVAASLNLPVHEYLHRKNVISEEPEPSPRPYLDHPLVFYGVSILICIAAVYLWLPHYCLFTCEIIRTPLLYFSHTFAPQ